jgi:hypothetical protein
MVADDQIFAAIEGTEDCPHAVGIRLEEHVPEVENSVLRLDDRVPIFDHHPAHLGDGGADFLRRQFPRRGVGKAPAFEHQRMAEVSVRSEPCAPGRREDFVCCGHDAVSSLKPYLSAESARD